MLNRGGRAPDSVEGHQHEQACPSLLWMTTECLIEAELSKSSDQVGSISRLCSRTEPCRSAPSLHRKSRTLVSGRTMQVTSLVRDCGWHVRRGFMRRRAVDRWYRQKIKRLSFDSSHVSRTELLSTNRLLAGVRPGSPRQTAWREKTRIVLARSCRQRLPCT